jgi:hypothetical protein
MLNVLYLIADALPVLDEICHRVLNFIFVCYNCDSQLVKCTANFDVNFEHVNSPMGHNALVCSLRYNVSLQQLCASRLSYDLFWQHHMSHLDNDKIARTRSAIEIVLIRDGFLMVPYFLMTADNMNGLLNERVT